MASATHTAPAVAPKAGGAQARPQPAAAKRIAWGEWLAAIWALGCAGGAIRLVRLQLQLSHLRKDSRPAPDLQRLCAQIQDRLEVRRETGIHISEAVTSPFVCGLMKPIIILPETLVQTLSPGEMTALLSHEIAHLRRHDLVWCVAWRWMQTVCWFHPLVWYVPAAHNLACEQEADRMASGQLTDQDSYARLLARLALRVLALPAVETRLTLNGSAQIVRRLNHLGQKGTGVWNWKNSVGGYGMVGLLFLLAAGWHVSNLSSEAALVPAGNRVSTAQAVEAAPAGFRLTVELRDGSRVVGKSEADHFQFHSDTLGDLNLPLEEIRTVESQAETNIVKLATASGDSLTARYAMPDIRLETAYGEVSLPVALIKSVRVSVLGKIGRPTDGLIGLWSGEGNAVDSVAGNNGVLPNVNFMEGVVGQAFLFTPDNNPGYCGVQIADRPEYALTKSLTIECWIRPRGHSAYVIFFRGDHRPGLDPYSLAMDGNQNLCFGICDGDNDHNVQVKTPVGLGAWIHVAAVLDDDAGTASIYTNGVLAAQMTTSVRPFAALEADQSPGVGIGNVNDGGNNFPFDGAIDEVALYNRALSADEVNASYAEHAADAASRVAPLPQRNNMMPPRYYRSMAPVDVRTGVPVYNSD
jgi:beta-lactamase regulating signal transducer with metallopeptidase domain